jgi:hypothetical protein
MDSVEIDSDTLKMHAQGHERGKRVRESDTGFARGGNINSVMLCSGEKALIVCDALQTLSVL